MKQGLIAPTPWGPGQATPSLGILPRPGRAAGGAQLRAVGGCSGGRCPGRPWAQSIAQFLGLTSALLYLVPKPRQDQLGGLDQAVLWEQGGRAGLRAAGLQVRPPQRWAKSKPQCGGGEESLAGAEVRPREWPSVNFQWEEQSPDPPGRA